MNGWVHASAFVRDTLGGRVHRATMGITAAVLASAAPLHAQVAQPVYRIEIDAFELGERSFSEGTDQKYNGYQSEVSVSCEPVVANCFQQLHFSIIADRPATKKQKLLITLVRRSDPGSDMLEPPGRWTVIMAPGEIQAEAYTIWEESRLKVRNPGLLRVAVLGKVAGKPLGLSEPVVYFCSRTGLGGFDLCP
jgi:hypothetical protein